MSRESIQTSVVELAWSLWTEMGVPGVIRNHRNIVIDPEPLIIATPTLADDEPRLMEQAFGWCVTHSDRISASRLKGLLGEASQVVTSRFFGFATALRERGVKWPIPDSGPGWSPPSSRPSPSLPLDRPSLLRFRLRALSGVGARADILCELLANERGWLSASRLAETGYTKRNVARVLTELDAGGIVTSRKEGNSLRYRLAHRGPLTELVHGHDLSETNWRTTLGIVLDLLDLLNHEASPVTVRRVEANKLRDHLAESAQRVDLESPPPTRGVPDAWERILAWGSQQMREIAGGSG